MLVSLADQPSGNSALKFLIAWPGDKIIRCAGSCLESISILVIVDFAPLPAAPPLKEYVEEYVEEYEDGEESLLSVDLEALLTAAYDGEDTTAKRFSATLMLQSRNEI